MMIIQRYSWLRSRHFVYSRMKSISCRKVSFPVVLCVDFDQTMTQDDSIQVLFNAANSSHLSETARRIHGQKTEEIVEQYWEERKTFLSRDLRESNDLNRRYNVDLPGLELFLMKFGQTDLVSIQRVIEHKLLSGIHKTNIAQLSQGIELMNGCAAVLNGATAVYIISSNWSHAMIKCVIEPILTAPDDVRIISNDLAVDGMGISTGEIHLQVQAPADKAKYVRAVLDQVNRQIGEVVVFVGDSTNDLLGMLNADIGIILSVEKNSTIERVCRQFGITLVPLIDYNHPQDCQNAVKNARNRSQEILFTAKSWKDIGTILHLNK